MVVGIDPNPDEGRLRHDQVPGVKGPAGDETLSPTCGLVEITSLLNSFMLTNNGITTLSWQ